MEDKVKKKGSYIYLLKSLAKEFDDSIHYSVPDINDYRQDRLFYLLSFITILKYSVEENQTKEYVEISRKALKSKVSNYKAYLDYAFQEDILERSYYKEGKPYGYRFTEKYAKDINYEKLERRRLHSLIPRKEKIPQSHQHLVKWLKKDYLRVDYKACFQWLKEEKTRRLHEINSGNILSEDRNKELAKINGLYKGQHYLLDSIRCDVFRPSVDDKGYRFHSPLTRLKKNLRNFISFKDNKGKHHRLVSIDIKNSQPYFSTLIFSEKFISFISGNKDEDFFMTDPNFEKKIQTLREVLSSLDWLIFLDKINCEDVIKYKRHTVSGNLYEQVASEIWMKEKRSIPREEVKELIFTIYFSKNSSQLPEKKIFKTLFPTVYNLFYDIKKKDHAFLAILLQHIESYLVLNIICQRIAKESPQLPIYTIHDSIVTIQEAEAYVTHIIQEELNYHMGCPPILKSENWLPENEMEQTAIVQAF